MRYLPRTDNGSIKKYKDYRVTACFERNMCLDGHNIKRVVIEVQRDKWGKFHVVVDGRRMQYNLTAEGIVMYMANMLNNHRGK